MLAGAEVPVVADEAAVRLRCSWCAVEQEQMSREGAGSARKRGQLLRRVVLRRPTSGRISKTGGCCVIVGGRQQRVDSTRAWCRIFVNTR